MASPVASAALKARVRRPSLLNKLAHPEDLIQYFPNGAYVGWSGFTGVGYPKCVWPILLHPVITQHALRRVYQALTNLVL
jgi:acetyl-CoA hydrolase